MVHIHLNFAILPNNHFWSSQEVIYGSSDPILLSWEWYKGVSNPSQETTPKHTLSLFLSLSCFCSLSLNFLPSSSLFCHTPILLSIPQLLNNTLQFLKIILYITDSDLSNCWLYLPSEQGLYMAYLVILNISSLQTNPQAKIIAP